MMTRREAVARLSAMTGAAMIGVEFFLTGCARTDKSEHVKFSATDIALLDEIGETIIPATDTPGAKSVGIGAFIVMMVNDCYSDEQHGVLYDGLSKIDRAAIKAHSKPFVQLPPAERTSLLNQIDREQQKYTRDKARTDPPHYFRLMKELTVLGYFTSEAGCTKALRYSESPGAYNGDLPYKSGDRAFFNPSRRVG